MQFSALSRWRWCAPFFLAAVLGACGGGGGSGGSAPPPAPAVGEVTLLAGALDNAGFTNDVGATAQFRLPRALVQDAAGNTYVADSGNHVIRKIAPDGAVTHFAGSPTQPGSADGAATSAASFSSPRGLALDVQGNLYVADTGNHTIRRISTAGVVTTVAGAAAGNVYVADLNGIRRISVDGRVLTVSGSPSQITNPVGDNMLHALRRGAKGLAWHGGMLYATVDNAVLRIGPLP